MDNATKLTDNFAIAGQVAPEDLQQAKNAGYQAVLNLRVPGEQGFPPDAEQQAQAAGLQYANIPVSPAQLSDELADRVLDRIDSLPKPLLIHCGSAMRAGIMSLAHMATRQGMGAEQAFAQGKQAGFDCDAKPPMKQFVESYAAKRAS